MAHLVKVLRFFGHLAGVAQDFLYVGLQAALLDPDDAALRVRTLLVGLDGKRAVARRRRRLV